MSNNNDINPVVTPYIEEWKRLAETWGQARVEKALVAMSCATDAEGKRINLEKTGELLETVLPIISDKVTVDVPVLGED